MTDRTCTACGHTAPHHRFVDVPVARGYGWARVPLCVDILACEERYKRLEVAAR